MDSKLQIISGRFARRKLKLPPMARPTQNRARIALFNILESLGCAPAVVWDAFAGSGAFGMECLSRYADARVIFTDLAEPSLNVVRENLATLNVGAPAAVYRADAMNKIAEYGAVANLIFLDPPYADADLGAAFVRKLARVAVVGTLLVWEQDAKSATLPADAWEILRDKQYGRARFLVLRRRG